MYVRIETDFSKIFKGYWYTISNILSHIINDDLLFRMRNVPTYYNVTVKKCNPEPHKHCVPEIIDFIKILSFKSLKLFVKFILD